MRAELLFCKHFLFAVVVVAVVVVGENFSANVGAYLRVIVSLKFNQKESKSTMTRDVLANIWKFKFKRKGTT